MRALLIPLLSASLLCACASGAGQRPGAAEPAAAQAQPPAFDADSAMAFLTAQTSLGPRVPGTPAWSQCADYLSSTLTRLGAQEVAVQQAQATAFDGTRLPIRNITARVNPQATKRVLLAAHWDSRPWADNDPDPARRAQPIDGANDGASGVAVILEIARQLADSPAKVGVDILLVDAEDYGPGPDHPEADDAWALGSQHWAAHPSIPTEHIRYAILLDMVGGPGAVFHREYFSQTSAPDVVDKVWRAAAQAGHSSRFPNRVGGAVTDDHVYIARAGIPAIDIIENANPATGSFPPTWHTADDTAERIDPATLRAVGQTILQLLYTE